MFLSDRRNVLLVSSSKNDTNSVLEYGDADISGVMDGNFWICSEWGRGGGGGTTSCNPDKFVSTANNWTVFDHTTADHGIGDERSAECALHFSCSCESSTMSMDIH